MSRSEVYKQLKELGVGVRWNSPESRLQAMRERLEERINELVEAYTPARRPEGYVEPDVQASLDSEREPMKVEEVFHDEFGGYHRAHYKITGAEGEEGFYEGVEEAIEKFVADKVNKDVDLVFRFTAEDEKRFVTVTRDDIIIAGGDVQEATKRKLEQMSAGEIAGSDKMGLEYGLDIEFVQVKTGSLLGEGEATFKFAITEIREAEGKVKKGDCFWRTICMTKAGRQALEDAKKVNTIGGVKDWAAKHGRVTLYSDVPVYKVRREDYEVFDGRVYQAIEISGLRVTDEFAGPASAKGDYKIVYKVGKAGKGHFELFKGVSVEKYYVDRQANIYKLVDNPVGGKMAKLVQKRVAKSGEKKVVKAQAVSIITFDFETVFDAADAGLLVPYSVSWSVRVDNAISGKAFFYYGRDCVRVFVDWMMENQAGRKFVLVGYNSSRFDNFFLINELMRRDVLQGCKLVNGSILKMTFSGRHQVFDLCRYLACPLALACDQFKPVYRKKGDLVSHVEVQQAYNRGGRRGLDELFDLEEGANYSLDYDGVGDLEEEMPAIVKYNILDVLSCDCLYMMIDKILRDENIITAPLYSKSTIGGLAWSLLQTHFQKEGIKLAKLPIERYRAVRASLFAGRTQAYLGLHSETSGQKRYDMYDAKSLYPYAYLNRDFPCGEVVEMGYEQCKAEGKMGFYEVDFEQPAEMRVKVLPKREAGEALDWKYEGRMKMMVNTVDIAQLTKYGAKIHSIGEGFAFAETIPGGQLFKPMGICKNIKEAEDRKPANLPACEGGRNNVLRNMSKLLINSASGKVIQRVFQKTEMICKSARELKAVHEKVRNVSFTRTIGQVSVVSYEKTFEECFSKQNMPIYLGCFIYAHARAHMMDSVLADYHGIYQDTDSLLMPREEAERFAREKPHLIGGEFGQFELEDTKGKDIAKIVVVAPKCYFLFSEDDQLLKRGFKGVNMRSDKVLTADDIEDMVARGLVAREKDGSITLQGGLKEQFDAYHTTYAHRSLSKPENVAMLCNSLKSGSIAHILTSSLRKSVEELTISQRFAIKNIKVKG